MTNPYIERILKARVYDVAVETPLELAPRLSRRLGNQVLLKREDLQSVFSFKLRGAYNKVAHLSESAANRGVICASAGNHAQGVALAAQRRGVPAIIVMPHTTPQIKVQAVMDLGGEVVLHGDDYDSAFDRAQQLVRERNFVYVHAFDDPDVIAGQGTIGMEIMRQCGGDLDAVFVPVGGGGLIAGSATIAKELGVKRVVGVEPEAGDDWKQSFAAGEIIAIDVPRTIADGLQTHAPGELTWEVASRLVDEIVTVTDQQMVEAMRFAFERLKLVIEPSGAVGVAAVLNGLVSGDRIGVIVSGGNVGAARFAELIA